MKRVFFGFFGLVSVLALITTSGLSQPPGDRDNKTGKAGPPRFELGQVFPPPLVEELKLTADQQKEIEAIKKDLKAKLEKLLTDEQKKTVENFRPRGPGRPGGPGGKGPPPPGGGSKGNKGPDRPPVENDKPKSEPNAKNNQETAPAGDAVAEAATIQWFATLSRGLAEAQRTGKPILFVSAAPHCAGVSGMW